MPKVSKRKSQSRKANQVSVNTRRISQREKRILEIKQALIRMNDDELLLIYQNIIQPTNDKKVIRHTRRKKLIDTIEKLPDDQLKSAVHLLNTMRYSKGPNQGNLLSPFLQDKALDFVNSSLYRAGQSSSSLIQSNKALQKQVTKLKHSNTKKNHKVRQLIGSLSQYKRKRHQYISKVRATARRPLLVDSQTLKESIKAMIMKNKSQYTNEFINIATQISQVGQISFRSTVQATQLILGFLTGESSPLSKQSIIRWNKEISEMHVNEIFNQSNTFKFYSFGIMADESTRGQQKIFVLCIIFWNNRTNTPDFRLLEMKNLDRCTGNSVAQAIYSTFEHFKIKFHQCLTFVSDNTNYMSGKTGGAVALFNKLTGAESYRIPCSLHVVHNIMNNFEEVCFGKLPGVSGCSQKKLPANLLYLTWELHDGYSKSNKETPMGINSDHIRLLYQERIQYKLPKYQQPIRSRWLYELTCAEQYLEHREAHIQFVNWFLPCLKSRKNTPKTCIKKWELFEAWLHDPFLNIQIKVLIRFGKDFYRPFAKFVTGYDPNIQELIPNLSDITTFSGRRSHQMSDFVARTTMQLKNIVENPCHFFENELLEGTDLLNNDQFNELITKIELGAQKALELHQKWLNCWLHLPLSVCQLGGKHGREFARSFICITLNIPWSSPPSLRELCYAKFIEADVSSEGINDFGLSEALEDIDFKAEFLQFINEANKNLYDFPKIFEFIKYRIWYIVIHQQQVEGLFNKWDLKTHQNMTNSLQQSKLQLATTPLTEIKCSSFDLTKLRAKKRQALNEITSLYNQSSSVNQDQNLEQKATL
ncbi:hypothetical protein RhiirC2_816295 [Rhizophagus irregularis]|uniref:Uncharacterized protein n=1 Tax=Rhizophagus irregularis TaxID=588596 RepID=A0A2N1MJ47_9GLOM|nr:hypothetical protein RhiirC2_816295 [Rhizophagus irregularis]